MTGGPLDELLGVWVGTGSGHYPTIASFGYSEEVTFSAVPTKPFLAYNQRTRHATEDRPLHAESGYWRWVGDGARIEVVLAHPTGIAEILEGELHRVTGGFDLRLASREIALSTTAKDVRTTTREFRLRGDELHYEVAMGSVGLALQPHLGAVLQRR